MKEFAGILFGGFVLFLFIRNEDKKRRIEELENRIIKAAGLSASNIENLEDFPPPLDPRKCHNPIKVIMRDLDRHCIRKSIRAKILEDAFKIILQWKAQSYDSSKSFHAGDKFEASHNHTPLHAADK